MKNKEKSCYSVWQNVCFMIKLAWDVRKSVLVIGLLIIGCNIALSLINLLVAPLILIKLEQTALMVELLVTVIVFSGLMFAVRALLNYLNDRDGGRMEIRFAIREMLAYKAYTTSYPNVCDPVLQKMNAAARMDTDSDWSPTQKIWRSLTQLISAAAGFGICLVFLADINLILVVVVLGTSFLGFLVTKRMKQWGYRHRKERSEYINQFSYISERSESTVFAKDIRIFGLQPWLSEIQLSATRAYMAFCNRREWMHCIAGLVDVVLTVARNAVAYVYLIHQALSGVLSAGEFLLYFNAVNAFAEHIVGILGYVSELNTQSLGICVIREYLDAPESFCFEGGEPIPKTDAYELRLENVTFHYPGSDKVLFQNLNLTIHPREKLAVVGLNGAGKTSLVKLLCGFYDPDEGRVILNGKDIRHFNRREYYALFSAVFQEFSVLDATIRTNIAQTAEGADDGRVMECLREAGLTDFIAQLPNGLDTYVGRDVFLDGVLFSGGQTQRLMLARALYKNGPILVLDEPTAAMDPIAENDIYMKYNEMTAEKTALFISHRLASTRFCDRILYLEEGTVLEEGTHDQLLKLGGAYAQLFEVQSRYYQEGRDFRYEKV